MGVKDLWPVLLPVQRKRSLSELKGKKIAVDLSVWVMQAKTCKGLKQCKKPHLRNLYFRVSHLLTKGVQLVFVLEGKAPELKQDTIRKRLQVVSDTDSTFGLSRSSFQRTLKECQELLNCMGVPCVKSLGEAEKLCAFLNAEGLVDGCITEDSDAFLYGARTVYRDFASSPQDPHVMEFSMDKIEKELNLDRRKLIALALLLGCDYSGGIGGIGEKTALSFISELKHGDIIERFKEWKDRPASELFPLYNFNLKKAASHCVRCHHPGTHTQHTRNGCKDCNSDITCYHQSGDALCPCDYHRNILEKKKIENELKIYEKVKEKPGFPNQEVIDEYLKCQEKLPGSGHILWTMPNLILFQEKAVDWFGWTLEYSFSKLLQLLAHWQIEQLCKDRTTDCTTFPIEPVRILKMQKKAFQSCYVVLWTDSGNSDPSQSSQSSIGSSDSKISDKFQTLESQDDFESAYPDVAKAFKMEKELEAQQKEEEKKAKRKRGMKTKKKTDTPVNNQGSILKFFTPASKTKESSCPSHCIAIATSNTNELEEPVEKKPLLDTVLLSPVYCSEKMNSLN